MRLTVESTPSSTSSYRDWRTRSGTSLANLTKWTVKSSSGQSQLAHICDTPLKPFHRLKKVQGKKKRDAEASEKLKKALDAEEGAQVEELASSVPEHAGGGGDLLSSKDEDVIF